MTVFQEDFSGAAGEGEYFREGIQMDQGGAGDAEKAAALEALFELVQGRVHPILAVFRDQLRQSVFRREVYDALLSDHDVMRRVSYDEAHGAGRAATHGAIEAGILGDG